MENALLTELESKGCRIKETLEETYMGAEALMVRIIKKVPSTTCFMRMSAALAAADARGVFEASHELKGLYATTALTPLYEKCCEIVEVARAGSLDGIPEKLTGLQTMHDEFCGVIGR